MVKVADGKPSSCLVSCTDGVLVEVVDGIGVARVADGVACMKSDCTIAYKKTAKAAAARA